MIGPLKRILSHKNVDLEAKLKGVNGFTGYGEIEFAEWKSGTRKLDIGLRGCGGAVAEVYANDVHTATVNLNNGRVDYTFSTRKGDAVPQLAEGTRMEIRQNGDAILSGVLAFH